MNEHIISEFNVLPEDFAFLKRVAAGVSAKASAYRNSKTTGNAAVPLIPVPVLRQVESAISNKRSAAEVEGLGPTQVLKKLSGSLMA